MRTLEALGHSTPIYVYKIHLCSNKILIFDFEALLRGNFDFGGEIRKRHKIPHENFRVQGVPELMAVLGKVRWLL